MKRTLSQLGLVSLVLAASTPPALAQTATTGSVAGTVKDANGAPVAAATIRLTSPQMTRTFTTGIDGKYRFPLLNVGAWKVRVTKPGFQATDYSVTITPNNTETLNLKIAPEASSTVSVYGTVTSVDVTSTQTGYVATAETFNSLPIASRDVSALAFLSPGVVSSGFGNSAPSISGASGAENQYIVDGLNTTDFRYGWQGASLNTDFIDQVEVQTGGFQPEYSALGGVFNVITKSGSNELTGSAWTTIDLRGIEAGVKRSPYYIQTDPNSRYDLGGSVGGPIIKDKLFYFVGTDVTRSEAPTVEGNNQGLVGSKWKEDDLQVLGKINWMVATDHQLTFTAEYNSASPEQEIQYLANGSGNVGFTQKDTTLNYNVTYDWTITPTLFLSAKAGKTSIKNDIKPTNTADPLFTDTLVAAAGNPYYYGGYGLNQQAPEENATTQYKVDLSWSIGTHTIKGGYSHLSSTYKENANQSGGTSWQTVNDGSGLTGADALFAIDKITENTDHASVKANFDAFYIQDSWEVSSGLRLKYGFRYEIQEQVDWQGKTFMKFDSFKDQVQPRLGIVWDVNNDGKSKAMASYATYYENIPQRLAIRVFANEVYTRDRWYGVNYGGTGTYISSNDPRVASQHQVTGDPDRHYDYAAPFSFDPIAEGIKLPQRQEYTLGYEQKLEDGWSVGTHAKYRHLKDPIEDSVITHPNGDYYDPGQPVRQVAYDPANPSSYFYGQAILWNPNPGPVSWTSRSTSGLPNQHFTVDSTGFPEAYNRYRSLDLVIEKKTERAYLNFSYTWSNLEGNYEGVVSSSNAQSDGNITASFDYYPYVGTGDLPLDREHVLKLQTSYKFDVGGNDLNVGANFTYQSGNPISLFDDGSTSNGYAPGWDTTHALTQSNLKTYWVANSDALYAIYSDSTNPKYSTYFDANGKYIGPASMVHKWLDIGQYGNAVPANGSLGQYGRTHERFNTDLHIDYVFALPGHKKVKAIPSLDIFNFFNSRTATGLHILATDQGGSADPRYRAENAWQEGRRYRFGFKVQF